MDDEVKSLIKKETWEAVPSNFVADHQVLSVTWYFKYKSKTDGNIIKFKALFCVIRDVQNILSPEPLEAYSTVVQWDTVRLTLI